MRALITTAPSGEESEVAELAARFGLEAQPRAGRGEEALLAAAAGAPVLVLGRPQAVLLIPGAPPVRFRATSGMAVLRLQRALAGEGDALAAAARLAPGDAVIDATLGLGADALLAAWATGARVLAIEKSPVLAAFTQAALRRPGGKGALCAAARAAGERIDVRCGDHLAVLASLPSRSADVVLFDPMFHAPQPASPLFQLVRACADPAPLADAALDEARRVARRGVLLKDAAPGRELGRRGLRPLPSRRFPRIVFGWLDAR